MIRKNAQNVRYFFYSRHVSDALLITAGILIPSVILARYQLFETGVIVSLGALCVGVTDVPGPFIEKLRGLMVCNVVNFMVAVVTGYAAASVYFESAEIVALCFFFSMFTVYGARASAIGTTALMVMITIMYRHNDIAGVWEYAGFLLVGGIWYTALSVLFYKLFPYRQIEQVLGECILETTKSLRLKAMLYDLHVDQSEGVNALIQEQIRVNEKQDDSRQLLFSNPAMASQQGKKGRVLVAIFVELMDVYEQIVSTSYYESIRTRFAGTNVPPTIKKLLEGLAENLRSVGRAVQANSIPRRWVSTSNDFIVLKRLIDDISLQSSESNFVLKKALITFRTMDQRIQSMAEYLRSPDAIVTDQTAVFRFDLFLNPGDYSVDVFLKNMSFQSSTFRYALRVSLVAIAGFVISRLVSGAGHSYWILFTVVFIMKPAFSLSKERNFQRIAGTVAGGAITFPLMMFVHNNSVLFILLMSFMLIAYSFMRVNYMVFVIFLTCYVLLMFKLLGTGGLSIVGERVVDTLVGAAMAFAAIYFIFPNWEFKQIRIYIQEMVRSNRNYLGLLEKYFAGRHVSVNDYKLARKDAFNHSANLAGSFQRMNSEPRSKRKNIEEIQRFIIANHRLSSLISSNASAIFTGKLEIFRNTPGNHRYMTESLHLLDEAMQVISTENSPTPVSTIETVNDSPVVKNQLKVIRDRCNDILRATIVIFTSPHN